MKYLPKLMKYRKILMKYNAYLKEVIFSLVKKKEENIKSDISLLKNINFWMTSALLCLTSELQTRVTSLFVNKNIKCGCSFS